MEIGNIQKLKINIFVFEKKTQQNLSRHLFLVCHVWSNKQFIKYGLI